MTTWRRVTVAGVLVGAAVLQLASPHTAAACGGCFAPSSSVTVVTAHRMAVSISATQTTLWDQIQYAGAPDGFVWILPVGAGASVELADNDFFGALEAMTAPVLQLDPWLAPFCGPPPECWCCAGAAPMTPDPASVTVHHEGTLGPYETATIGSADPDALITWLREHGYAIPDSARPIIQHYVGEGMDFVALRLGYTYGVQQMQPVRVTVSGLNPIFPLRMVAAGVSDEVELLLWVIADGRWEAANFRNDVIDFDRLTYDWDSGRFDYDEVFRSTVADPAGVWVTESTVSVSPLARDWSWRAPPTWEERTPSAEDVGRATSTLAAPMVTRMRTVIGAAALDRDLVLQAGPDERVSSDIRVQRATGTPPACPPPWWTDCGEPPDYSGSGSGSSRASPSTAGGTCSAAHARAPTSGLASLVLAAAAVLARRRRLR